MRWSHGLIDQLLLRTAHDSCLLFIEKDLGSRTEPIGGWLTSAIIPGNLVLCMAAVLTESLSTFRSNGTK